MGRTRVENNLIIIFSKIGDTSKEHFPIQKLISCCIQFMNKFQAHKPSADCDIPWILLFESWCIR